MTGSGMGPTDRRKTDLVSDVVEHGHHVAHMGDGKDRVEHSPLLAMMGTCVMGERGVESASKNGKAIV